MSVRVVKVKARSKKEAREKMKKKYPSRIIYDVDEVWNQLKTYTAYTRTKRLYKKFSPTKKKKKKGK